MEFTDYYKTLEIPKSATAADIKKAYRRLARKYHPDLKPNDKEAERKFKELNQANEVLSNPENRKKYDKYGKDWKHATEFEQSGYNPNEQQNSGRKGQSSDFSGDFSDFFESIYGNQGGGRQRTSQFSGQDLNASLQLSLKDVYTTQKQTLTVNNKKIRITIPAGVENGQVIKISGHGAPGTNGAANGDLFITFSIIDSSGFKRQGSNLYADTEVDLYTALLGGEILVNTFDGKAKLKIPEGTTTGTKVKLKGKGFPVYKKEGQFGDLFITYIIKLPGNLSNKEKELFTELSKLRAKI